jgi:WD40 repeat protein
MHTVKNFRAKRVICGPQPKLGWRGRRGLRGLRVRRGRTRSTSTWLSLLSAALSIALVAPFTGATPATAQLPDNRAYELVTPAPSGEPYMPLLPILSLSGGFFQSSLPIQAATDGEALAYVGEAPVQGGDKYVGDSRGNSWMSVRGPTGWRPAAIQPESEESVYEAFNQNLTEGFLEGGRTPGAGGSLGECRPLYSAGIGSQPVEFFTLVTASTCGNPLYAGASADGTVLIQSEAALTPNALPSSAPRSDWGIGEGCTVRCNLYEASGGGVTAISELDGQPVPSANFGGRVAGGPPNFGHAISADGSRIFWTDTQEGESFGRVFVREDKAKSIPVSLGEAEYVAATVDGHFAYYIEAGVLWRFDTDTSQRSAVTPATYSEGGEVLGVLGINEEGEDGAYIYYVDGSVLAGGQNGHGESAQAGQPNLYLDHDGQVVYIATLSSEDNEVDVGTGGGDWKGNLGLRTSELTPDGENLIFESNRGLTGYDNRPPRAESSIFEVFHYDARTAKLACASCAPSGLPPESYVLSTETYTRLPVSTYSDVQMRRWMSSDGSRVFFDSTAALTPGATNHQQDVYEWESEGTNECPAQPDPPANGGCVYLLSSGSSPSTAAFVEADASGDNAFFEQRGSLGSVSPGSDGEEIYDARVDGGIPSPIAECARGNCSPPVQAPAQAPPLGLATAEGAGLGNFPAQPPASASKPKPQQRKPTRKQLLAAALKHCQRLHRPSARSRCRRSATKKYGGRTR